MSILLIDLIADLAEDVPAVDGVPSTEQYERAVMEAARAFSERCGLEQIGTLNIVPGTATYNLPADFVKLIKLAGLFTPDGIIHSAAGLIPVPATWEERFTVRNGQITFHPTPTYTVARDFRYKAAWIPTIVDDDYDNTYEYVTMGEREADIVLLKAKALATMKVVNVSSGMKYSLGAVSVDNSGTTAGLTATSEAFDQQFDAECRKYNGTAMSAS